jgi:hypothetical protein
MNLFIPEITQEECAEVIQAISKIQRFGLHQQHPETGVSNSEALAVEIGQLEYMLHRIKEEYNLDPETIDTAWVNKGSAVLHWAKF